MPQRLRFLVRFGDKVQFDLYFELAPARLGDFEGRGLDGAERVRVGFVELELDFLEPVAQVSAVDAADVDGPLMGVFGVDARWAAGGVDGFGYRTENYVMYVISGGRSRYREKGTNRRGGRWKHP